jgi:hypothetical protein
VSGWQLAGTVLVLAGVYVLSRRRLQRSGSNTESTKEGS